MVANVSVQKLYVAYFNRPADTLGLNYWVSVVAANGGNTAAVSAAFASSAEYAATYAGMSTAARVDAIYTNLFGRGAEPAGLTYWGGLIESGKITIANAVTQIAGGAQGTDLVAYNNKTTAAVAFTRALDTTAEIVGYSGTAANNAAKAWMTGITNDATLTAATTPAALNASIATTVASGGSGAEGAVLALTSGTDAFSTTASAATSRTTAGNDTINGVIQAMGASGTTIAPGDSIDGGAGVDTLNISVAGLATGDFTLSAIQTNSVEKVLLANFDTRAADATIVAADLMTGLTTVGLASSSADGDTVFSGLKNLVGAEMRNGAADLTLTYNTSVVSGTADTQNLTVSNLSGGAFAAAGIETLNVTSELVKSTLASVTSAQLKTINVAGSADLTVTGAVAFAATANGTAIDGTIDASTFTGKLSIDASGSASTVSVKGGSGNDTIKMGATLTTNDVIDGGAGTDTVQVTGNGTATLAVGNLKLSNVETLQVAGGAGNAQTINADKATVTKIVAVENANDAIALTITNLAANANVDLVQSVDGTGMGAVNLSLKDASGTSDAINIAVLGTSKQGVEAVASITASNIETINLSSGFTGSTATVAADSNVITNATFASATKMVVTGNTNLTFTNAISGSALKTIDASALTGKLSIVAAAVDLSLTSGSGDDTLTMGTTLTAADTIDGGSGTKDTLTATIDGLGTSTTAAALKIANVETISFEATTNASFINAAGITGATALNIGDANGADGVSVTLTNLAANLSIGLGGLAADKEFKGTVDASLAVATGSADAITFVLADTDTDNDVNATLKVAAAVETVNITASTDATANDATLNVVNVKSATINLTKGNATEVVALGTLSTTTTTLNASAFDGLLSVTGSATGTSLSVKTGSALNTIVMGAGNDTVTIGALNGEDADGGGGTDVLNATITTNATTDATKNFETVNYTIGNNVQSVVTGIDGLGVDGAKTFNLLGGDALTTFAIDYVSPANLTSINMGGFTGKSTQSTFAASQLVNTIAITGSAGTDTVIATTANNNAAVKSMTGVETLTLNVAGGNSTFDFSVVSGLKTIKVDDDNNARTITLNKVATGTAIEVTNGAASTVVIDLADKALETNAVSVTVATTTATVDLDLAEVETLNLINKSGASTVDLAGLAITASGKVATLNVSGDKALTINALNADVTTIDASGMSTGGSVIQTGRSQTTAATYTGSLGDDTFMMRNAADTIDGGAGTDTLVVSGNLILGGIQIDLNSTGDQITSYNGSSNAAVQKGFENINLSGVTGSFGADITAKSTGSTITGTANADQISGGGGNDVITGGAGNDFITGGGGSDTFVMTGAIANLGSDTISDFAIGAVGTGDIFRFTGANIGDGDTVLTFTSAAAVSAAALSELNVFTTALANDAAIIAAIQTITSTTPSLHVFFNTDTGRAEVWFDASANADGGETKLVTLTGVANADLANITATNFVTLV